LPRLLVTALQSVGLAVLVGMGAAVLGESWLAREVDAVAVGSAAAAVVAVVVRNHRFSRPPMSEDLSLSRLVAGTIRWTLFSYLVVAAPILLLALALSVLSDELGNSSLPGFLGLLGLWLPVWCAFVAGPEIACRKLTG